MSTPQTPQLDLDPEILELPPDSLHNDITRAITTELQSAFGSRSRSRFDQAVTAATEAALEEIHQATLNVVVEEIISTLNAYPHPINPDDLAWELRRHIR